MKMPEKITSRWLGTLDDTQLQAAEGQLHTKFAKLDSAEKAKRGEDYALLRGPEALVDAWMRWSMVSNAARGRGLLTARRR
jgi:hypothetical protein